MCLNYIVQRKNCSNVGKRWRLLQFYNTVAGPFIGPSIIDWFRRALNAYIISSKYVIIWLPIQIKLSVCSGSRLRGVANHDRGIHGGGVDDSNY